MSERPRVGGLDPRFAPRRLSRGRLAIVLIVTVLGAIGGILFAASTVPSPNCGPEDGMCRLQRIYLAQGVKVVFAMLFAYLLADFLFVRIPDRAEARRRRDAYERELALRPPPEAHRPFDAAVARAALDRVGQTASLPPAALRALEGSAGDAPPVSPSAAGPPSAAAGTPATTPSAPARAAREALAAVSAPAGLPPAALAALAARPVRGREPRAAPLPPAPVPAVDSKEAARAALEAVSKAPRLPPAALEALMRQGPALGGRRPPPPRG